MLTSRVAVADIQRFQDGAAPVIDVDRLSEEAGAELLRDNDVWGIDKELRAASRDFGGDPLALTLLASFLKETQTGDVRRRDHVRGLIADADNPRHEQARREAFAPLNGLVEPSPPPPVFPDAVAASKLKDEALKQLDMARKLISICGYHRRDQELAELDAVVAGARRFADLPPRVRE